MKERNDIRKLKKERKAFVFWRLFLMILFVLSGIPFFFSYRVNMTAQEMTWMTERWAHLCCTEDLGCVKLAGCGTGYKCHSCSIYTSNFNSFPVTNLHPTLQRGEHQLSDTNSPTSLMYGCKHRDRDQTHYPSLHFPTGRHLESLFHSSTGMAEWVRCWT